MRSRCLLDCTAMNPSSPVQAICLLRVSMSKSAKLESALRVAGTVALFVGLALMIVGCMVGPNYRRPVVNMPQAYRAAIAPEVSNNSSSGASIGDQSWQSIFTDSVLKKLIAEALSTNLDLKVAAKRVLEAQAQVGLFAPNSYRMLLLVAATSPFNYLQDSHSRIAMAGQPVLSRAADSARRPHGTWISGGYIDGRPKPLVRSCLRVNGRRELRALL